MEMKALSRTHFERTEMLSLTKWAMDIDWKQLQGIADYMDAYTVERGSFIFREWEREAYLCIIAEGSVNILKEDEDGKNKVIANIPAGSIIGEMSIIDGSPRSASASAEEDTTLLVLDKASFEQMINEKPLLGVKLLMKIARDISLRLRRTSGALVEYLEE